MMKKLFPNLYRIYDDDKVLLRQLGITEFNDDFPHGDDVKVGKVIHNDDGEQVWAVTIFVGMLPACFWRFEIETMEHATYTRRARDHSVITGPQ